MKNTIEYQFAENSLGNRIDINNINNSNEEKYFCISCKQELVPRLGNIRAHHFYHKNPVYNCSKETYLHELGKKTFYETYLQCLYEKTPFYICSSLFNEFSSVCNYFEVFKSKKCIMNNINKINLTKYFINIEMEKNQENYRPDITLINNLGERIFIEIAVTHPCEEEKIKSKNKIIEITIKKETDINKILERIISEDSNFIKYYNFDNFNIHIEPFCNDNIKKNYLIVLKNGEKHTVSVIKKELCRFIYENVNNIENVTPIITNIPILPAAKLNHGGPRINDIDSKMNQRYYNNYVKKRRRK